MFPLRTALCILGAAAVVALLPSAARSEADDLNTAEDVIAALEKADPGSPEALNDHLEYAELLIEATELDCGRRLDIAQTHLDEVAQNPIVDVVLPNGRARATDVRYRIHLARASCNTTPPARATELHEALAAAQQAVGLYRDALDYQSMAVMQFNVGVTLRLLSDQTAAVAALKGAVAMDREYGFRQEFEDNGKLLGLWQNAAAPGEPASAAAPAAPAASASAAPSEAADAVTPGPPAQNLPTRVAKLKFAWASNDATLRVEIDHASILADQIAHGRATRLFKQHVRPGHDGWVVSYEPGEITYDVAAWPGESSNLHALAYSFGPALPIPGFEVGAKGDFKHVEDVSGVASSQSAAVRALILDHTPSGESGSRLPTSIVRSMKLLFGKAAVEQNAAESYDFQTATWIGATLEQGVWYRMSALLTIPGARQLLLSHDVEFAYTHDVPCMATSPSPSCIELVVHATPRKEDIAALLGAVRPPRGRSHEAQPHYWATTYIRIVTDPNTLTTYVYDVRRYLHASGGEGDINTPDNWSEKLVSTFTRP